MRLLSCVVATTVTFSSFAHAQLAIKDITVGLPVERFKAIFPAAQCADNATWLKSCDVKRITVAERPRADDPNIPPAYHTVASQAVGQYVGVFEDGKLARFNVWFTAPSLEDKEFDINAVYDATTQKYGKPTVVLRGKRQWTRNGTTLTVMDGHEFQSLYGYMGIESTGFEERRERRLKRDEMNARAKAAPKNAKDL
jgi:hypothetical protein